MNDRDFDDIGKRLYDLEADPPKDGWDKIYPYLRQPGAAPAGKLVFLRENWWKSLFLLLPVAIYFTMALPEGNEGAVTSSLSSNIAEAGGLRSDEGSSTLSDEQHHPSIDRVTSTNEGNLSSSASSGTPDNGTTGQGTTILTEKAAPTQTYESQNPEEANNGTRTASLTARTVDESGAASQGPRITTAVSGRQEHSIQPVINEWEQNDQKEKADDIITTTGVVSTNSSSVIISRPSKNDADLLTGGERGDGLMATQEKSTVTTAHINDIESGASVERPDENARKLIGVAGSILPPPVSTVDGAAAGEELLSNTSDELASANEMIKEEKEDEGNKDGGMREWRITAAFTPQFMMKTARPIGNDEVLVTGINTNSGSTPERIGYGISLGASTEILPSLYIDGQLTYVRARQNISYSYATGKVDTLLAQAQSDGTVRVIPVYQVNTTERSTAWSYGGFRLGATYYFWSRAGRRFNISASGGMHYLLDSEVRENRNGTWTTLPNGNVNSTDYSMMIGAGYNVAFARGWELMINPAINYFLRSTRSSELPYYYNQRSYGINVMLSKTLTRAR
jgi:hypothetical protein